MKKVSASTVFARAKDELLGIAALALTTASGLAQGADVCANADIATLGSNAFDTTMCSDTGTLATNTSPSSCGTTADVWFTFTPAVTAGHLIELCGSTYDVELTIYDGSCGVLNQLACNDDFCGLQSGFVVNLIAGIPYFVNVGYWAAGGGVWGTGTLNITEDPFPPPSGFVSSWLNEVASGTPASYVNSLIPGPMTDDIGLTNGTNGVTYEFIAYGTNFGSSSALMGSLNTGVGDAAGFKFEQYSNTLQYGVTEFGIADWTYPGANTEYVDLHLVFVADTAANSTELFVDGVSMGTVAAAPVLQGVQGIGKTYRPGLGDVDFFTGLIHGVAVYEAQLSLQEIIDHRDAYFLGSIGMNYCISTVNSTGNASMISATGTESLAANDLTLSANNLPTQPGIFIAGPMPAQIPFFNGFLCVAPNGLQRFSTVASPVGGVISEPVDYATSAAGGLNVVAGASYHYQRWNRDPAAGGSNANFSDGVEIVHTP